MCEAMKVLMHDEIAEEVEKGKLAAAIETAKKMIARGKMSLEEIAEDTELPLTKVRELAEQKTA